MIPSIFVSSTIQDLAHLRDSVRETIIELGYYPVMSDYGDIGYLPNQSVEEACYKTMRESNLAIVIIGKRYGSTDKNNFSITHNEFKSAKEKEIPVITLIDKEVLTFKRVYDQNRGQTQDYPAMDDPNSTFSFIQEIMETPLNNGILGFETTTEAINHLKKQLAHLFGDLLTQKYDPVQKTILDVYSEIKTLNHELLKTKGDAPKRYMKATRFLLSTERMNKNLADLVKALEGSIDVAIPIMLESKSFDDFLDKVNAKKYNIKGMPPLESGVFEKKGMLFYSSGVMDTPGIPLKDRELYNWGVAIGKKVYLDDNAKSNFDITFDSFLKESAI